MFRNPTIQRIISTLLTVTFCTVQAALAIAATSSARNLSSNTWVPIDPSFKQDQRQPGLNLASSINLNQAGLFNSATQGATCTANSAQSLNQANIQAGYTAYQTQITQLISAQGQNLTVGNVLGSTSILPENYNLLLGSLPYQTIAVCATSKTFCCCGLVNGCSAGSKDLCT